MDSHPEVTLRLIAARRAMRWAVRNPADLSLGQRWTCFLAAVILVARALWAAVRP